MICYQGKRSDSHWSVRKKKEGAAIFCCRGKSHSSPVKASYSYFQEKVLEMGGGGAIFN